MTTRKFFHYFDFIAASIFMSVVKLVLTLVLCGIVQVTMFHEHAFYVKLLRSLPYISMAIVTSSVLTATIKQKRKMLQICSLVEFAMSCSFAVTSYCYPASIEGYVNFNVKH